MRIRISRGGVMDMISEAAEKIMNGYGGPEDSTGRDLEEVARMLHLFPSILSRMSGGEATFLGWNDVEYSARTGLVITFQARPDGSFASDPGRVDRAWKHFSREFTVPSYINLDEDGSGEMGLLPECINTRAVREDPESAEETISAIRDMVRNSAS